MPSGCGRTSITSEDLVRLIADPEPFLAVDDPEMRRLAVSVCSVSPSQHVAVLSRLAIEDADAMVRAMAVEGLGHGGEAALPTLTVAADDEDGSVREAVATAYGELGDPVAVDWLLERARDDDDRLVREAAVAALGAIGDDRAVPVLLELVADGPPRVRRRAVVALTVFDDPAIEPAIRQAAADRNPGVREAAEMVVGRAVDQ